MTSTTITPELREELLAMLRQELTQQEADRQNRRTIFQRVCNGFEDDFNSFDWVDVWNATACDGRNLHRETKQEMAYKIKSAIGTLLRAIYQEKSINRLPADKEQEMREFVKSVLALMKEKKEN